MTQCKTFVWAVTYLIFLNLCISLYICSVLHVANRTNSALGELLSFQ